MILSASAGAAATGVYAAAYRLVDIGLYAPNIFVGARFPALARQWDDPGQRHALLRDAARQLVRLAGIAGVAGVLLARRYSKSSGLAVRRRGRRRRHPERRAGADVPQRAAGPVAARSGSARRPAAAYIAATGAMVAIGVPLIIVAGAPGAAGATLATEVVLVRGRRRAAPPQGRLAAADPLAGVARARARRGPEPWPA
jgi:hypothetical protein